MTTLTIRDWRTRPRQAQKSLAHDGQVVLTANGRPVALMLAVNAGSLDETLAVMRRARAMQALHEVRQEAKVSGRDRLSMADIDRVIAVTRRARRERKPA